MHGRGDTRVQVLVGKPGGKRPLRRPRRKWEDRIRMNLVSMIGWRIVAWIQVTQNKDRWLPLVNSVMNLRVPVPRSYLSETYTAVLVFEAGSHPEKRFFKYELFVP
jgi:hypothetical protein